MCEHDDLAGFAQSGMSRRRFGTLALGMTMGQWLCVPMVAGGIALLWWSRREIRS